MAVFNELDREIPHLPGKIKKRRNEEIALVL
jgi:hypothetical protein